MILKEQRGLEVYGVVDPLVPKLSAKTFLANHLQIRFDPHPPLTNKHQNPKPISPTNSPAQSPTSPCLQMRVVTTAAQNTFRKGSTWWCQGAPRWHTLLHILWQMQQKRPIKERPCPWTCDYEKKNWPASKIKIHWHTPRKNAVAHVLDQIWPVACWWQMNTLLSRN